MKSQTLNFLFFVMLLSSCSNKIIVRKETYSLKSFGINNDQTIDMRHYKSPNLRIGQDSNKLVIVCASGGGSRAASYTIATLLELEKILLQQTKETINSENNILNEIDYFSTTSGGGWGASSFLAYLYQKQRYESDSFKNKILKFNSSLQGKDTANKLESYPTFNSYEKYLANRVDWRYARYQLVYFISDLIGKGSHKSNYVIMNRLNAGYIGWRHRADIEKALWENENKDIFLESSVHELMLSDVFKLKNSSEKPNLPMQIANTTNIDNFKLIPFSPDRLRYWGISQYTEILGKRNPIPPVGSLSIEQILQIPFAAGIKASSSVPGFIGSTNFKSQKNGIDYYLHLQDGGIVDNQALHTAKAILNQESTITDKTKRILIIIDASGSGVQNDKEIYKKQNARRRYSVRRSTLNATPDAQYPLMRERITAIENEYHCTVIYLGTEVLLDSNFGKPGIIPQYLRESKAKAENKFYEMYRSTLQDTGYFTTIDINDRSLLYEYIRSEVPTWFSSTNSSNKGKYLIQPELTKGSAKVMFLAGRGVVQLKKDEINLKFNGR